MFQAVCTVTMGARSDGAHYHEVATRPLDRTIDMRISRGECTVQSRVVY